MDTIISNTVTEMLQDRELVSEILSNKQLVNNVMSMFFDDRPEKPKKTIVYPTKVKNDIRDDPEYIERLNAIHNTTNEILSKPTITLTPYVPTYTKDNTTIDECNTQFCDICKKKIEDSYITAICEANCTILLHSKCWDSIHTDNVQCINYHKDICYLISYTDGNITHKLTINYCSTTSEEEEEEYIPENITIDNIIVEDNIVHSPKCIFDWKAEDVSEYEKMSEIHRQRMKEKHEKNRIRHIKKYSKKRSIMSLHDIATINMEHKQDKPIVIQKPKKESKHPIYRHNAEPNSIDNAIVQDVSIPSKQEVSCDSSKLNPYSKEFIPSFLR